MKKLFSICFVFMLAFNGFAQSDGVDYSLEGLAKVCANYDYVSSFHDGLAIVKIQEGPGEYKCGAIDKQGNVVIPCIHDGLGDFHEGLASAYRGGMVDVRKCGVINSKGKMIVACKYDDVGYFSGGYAVVKKYNHPVLHGLIDSLGKEVLPCVYSCIDDFSEGIAYAYSDNVRGFINSKGKIVVPTKGKYGYDDCHFSEGMCPVIDEYKVCHKDTDLIEVKPIYGFIDRSGKIVISISYDEVGGFSEGLSAVAKNGKWGYIDKNGTTVIPLTYNSASSFKDGIALVDKNDKFVFIDKNGKQIFPQSYEEAKNFSEGLAAVKKNDKWIFIDKNGQQAFPQSYEEVESFSEGLALVMKDYKWGFIDKNGKSTFDFISGSKNVEQLKKNVATIDSHKQEVKTNDDMSSCWFVYGKKRELESENVIANDKIADNFNKEYFSEIKKDKKEVFNLYSTAAKVLSNHPSDSYELSKNDKGYYYLRIIDPSSFWTYTNYLVIVVE